MKRCPACKRVENDDALVYCRADGTALVSWFTYDGLRSDPRYADLVRHMGLQP